MVTSTQEWKRGVGWAIGLGKKIDFSINRFFFNDVDSISILKSRESIFSGIYFSTHLKQDLINVILIISLLH